MFCNWLVGHLINCISFLFRRELNWDHSELRIEVNWNHSVSQRTVESSKCLEHWTENGDSRRRCFSCGFQSTPPGSCNQFYAISRSSCIHLSHSWVLGREIDVIQIVWSFVSHWISSLSYRDSFLHSVFQTFFPLVLTYKRETCESVVISITLISCSNLYCGFKTTRMKIRLSATAIRRVDY